jgi:hypothetical protein
MSTREKGGIGITSHLLSIVLCLMIHAVKLLPKQGEIKCSKSVDVSILTLFNASFYRGYETI